MATQSPSSRFVRIIWRTVVLSGCVLFATAILCPFLTAKWIGLKIPEAYIGPKTLWSFKETYLYGNLGERITIIQEESFFFEYWLEWFRYPLVLYMQNTGLALTCMFALQLLTVSCGILAIAKENRYAIFLSTLFSTYVLFFMMLVNAILMSENEYIVTLNSGFWLTLLSIVPFVLAVLMHVRLERSRLVRVS